MLTKPAYRSSLGIGHSSFSVIGSHILHPGPGDKITTDSLTAKAVSNQMGPVHPVSFISPPVIQADPDDLVLFRPAARVLVLRNVLPPACRIFDQLIVDIPDCSPGSSEGIKLRIYDFSFFRFIAYFGLSCLYHVIRSHRLLPGILACFCCLYRHGKYQNEGDYHTVYFFHHAYPLYIL